MRASRFVCALLLAAALSVPASGGVRIRSVSVNAGYMYRPYYWGYYGPYWSPFWTYAPFYYPYYPGLFDPFLPYGNGHYGEVRLDTSQKAAEVFINGGYAGLAGKLKTLRLEPGAYELEVRGAAGAYSRKIYVLSGKTLRVEARLMPQGEAK